MIGIFIKKQYAPVPQLLLCFMHFNMDFSHIGYKYL